LDIAMAAASFAACGTRVLVHEGGYVNHPADPGGPTNKGITLATFRRYLKPGGTIADLRAMTTAQALIVYRAQYWNTLRLDMLPGGLDDCLFDYGVNSGIGRAGKVLRRVLGLPDATHVVTDQVLAAVANRDTRALINAVCDERLAFLRRLKTWSTFGAGWTRRVTEVRSFALHLAEHPSSSAAPLPTRRPMPVEPAHGKGEVPAPVATKTIIKSAGGVSASSSITFHEWALAHPLETGAIAAGAIVITGAAAVAISRWHQAQQHAATPGISPVPVAA
jgi:lysozyme family protein